LRTTEFFNGVASAPAPRASRPLIEWLRLLLRTPQDCPLASPDAASEEMIALNTALDELEQSDERKVRVIELRFFLGCINNEEAAELLGIPSYDRPRSGIRKGMALSPSDRTNE
jgi:hypothetical protein